MKKAASVIASIALITLALAASSLLWADGSHQEEGSGMKTTAPKKEGSDSSTESREYKDKKHSGNHSAKQKGSMEEGSGAKPSGTQETSHEKMEEGSKTQTPAPKREGS